MNFNNKTKMSMINKAFIYKIFSVIFLFSVASVNINGQIPAPDQKEPVALINGTVVTVSGDIIEEGTVVFEDGEITAVGNDVSIPENAQIEDISGKYLYPAMIHSGTHLGLREVSRVSETVDIREYGEINPNVRAEIAFNAESRHVPFARSHGIAVAIVKPAGGIISGMAAAMTTDGWTWEDLVYQESAGMVINWPSMDDQQQRDEAIEKLKEAFKKARRYYKAKKASEDYFHVKDVRWEAMIPVLEGEVPVIINASDYRQIQSAIEWAEKEDIEIILSGINQADLVIPHIKDRDIPVIVNSVFSGPSRQWEPYDQSLTLPAKLYEAGIDFCITGGSSAANTIRLPNHATAAVAHGLPEKEALKSITLYPAKLFGIDHRMGSIQTGKDASLIIADGNLLHLSTQVEQVYIQGRKLDMMDKHRFFYEKYFEKYKRMEETD